MNFIKKVFEGISDDLVHLQFQKFSRGEFRNRAMIKVKKTAKKVTVSTSAEFGNELVRMVAEKLGDNSALVEGAIVSTADLEGKLEYKEKKQFRGVKRYLISKEMTGTQIISLLDEFPKNFFGLSFEVGETRLKIKPKAPKSGKPGSKGEDKPKIDFCRLSSEDMEFTRDFLFETKDFKEAIVEHTFFIDKIVIPDELKESKDFALVREKSKRKGKIVRVAEIDGKKVESEKEFEA